MADRDGGLLWANLSQATKSCWIVHPRMQRWKSYATGKWMWRHPFRSDIAREMLEFIAEHQVRSVAITDGIIGCPHKKESITTANGVRLRVWHGRDRFYRTTGALNLVEGQRRSARPLQPVSPT